VTTGQSGSALITTASDPDQNAATDGSAVSRLLSPALTTVAMPLGDIARRLVDRVIHEAAGVSHDRGQVLGTTLIWGESVQ
jgi:DNA-binding LacI/PurR family transcriptional regulator